MNTKDFWHTSSNFFLFLEIVELCVTKQLYPVLRSNGLRLLLSQALYPGAFEACTALKIIGYQFKLKFWGLVFTTFRICTFQLSVHVEPITSNNLKHKSAKF